MSRTAKISKPKSEGKIVNLFCLSPRLEYADLKEKENLLPAEEELLGSLTAMSGEEVNRQRWEGELTSMLMMSWNTAKT